MRPLAILAALAVVGVAGWLLLRQSSIAPVAAPTLTSDVIEAGPALTGSPADPPVKHSAEQGPVPGEPDSEPAEVGVYLTGSPTAGIKLTLARDGTYHFHTFAGLVTSRGTWRILGDSLVLTSCSIPGESYRYRLDGDRLHRVPDDHTPDGLLMPSRWETFVRDVPAIPPTSK